MKLPPIVAKIVKNATNPAPNARIAGDSRHFRDERQENNDHTLFGVTLADKAVEPFGVAEVLSGPSWTFHQNDCDE